MAFPIHLRTFDLSRMTHFSLCIYSNACYCLTLPLLNIFIIYVILNFTFWKSQKISFYIRIDQINHKIYLRANSIKSTGTVKCVEVIWSNPYFIKWYVQFTAVHFKLLFRIIIQRGLKLKNWILRFLKSIVPFRKNLRTYVLGPQAPLTWGDSYSMARTALLKYPFENVVSIFEHFLNNMIMSSSLFKIRKISVMDILKSYRTGNFGMVDIESNA